LLEGRISTSAVARSYSSPEGEAITIAISCVPTWLASGVHRSSPPEGEPLIDATLSIAGIGRDGSKR
jgi:hypothetical protein